MKGLIFIVGTLLNLLLLAFLAANVWYTYEENFTLDGYSDLGKQLLYVIPGALLFIMVLSWIFWYRGRKTLANILVWMIAGPLLVAIIGWSSLSFFLNLGSNF